MTETVTVTNVYGPNDYGFYDIKLEDGRKLSSKDEAIVGVARSTVGSEVEVEITERKKGQYTNYYLQKINGTGETRGAASGSRNAAKPSGGSRDPKTQKVIESEWAYGRAVELLSMSGEPVAFNTATQEALTQWADWLLVQIHK